MRDKVPVWVVGTRVLTVGIEYMWHEEARSRMAPRVLTWTIGWLVLGGMMISAECKLYLRCQVAMTGKPS